MEQFWNFLEEPDKSLIYKRNESGDMRFGELAETKRNSFGENRKIVLIGFPYDEGTIRNHGRPGSALGPDELRKAFYKLTPTKSSALHDAETRIFDAGNLKRNLKLEEALSILESIVINLLKQEHIPIVIGGSNDLSYADFRGCYSALGRCGAINIDAHLDVRDYSKGINSGTPYRMLVDQETLLGKDFVEYGIQEFANSKGHLSYAHEKGIHISTLNQIRKRGNSDSRLEHSGSALSFMDAYRIASHETNNVYVSFDLDSVRSSDAPGVSASTPTGLAAEEILECAYLAGSDGKTSMIDVCEFNPKFDVDGHTAKLAAMVVANFLAGLANRQ